ARPDAMLAAPKAAGRATVLADDRPPGLDLLDQLPRAGHALVRGTMYQSEPVSEAYVRANHARGTLTMTQRVESTPTQIWQSGDVVLARLETRAINVVSWIDEHGALRQGDIGVSYYGYTDLARLGDDSWRVRSLTRVMPIDNKPAPGSFA